jgi:hypothetical protein
VEDARARLPSRSKPSMMLDTSSLEKLLEAELQLYFHLGIADRNGGCIRDIPQIDMTADFNTYLNETQGQAVGDVLSAMGNENFELQQIVAARIDTLTSGSQASRTPRLQKVPKIFPEWQPKHLRRALRASMVTCAQHNKDKRFIPRGQLEEVCKIEVILQQLREAFPEGSPYFFEQLISLICHGEIPSTFAIYKPYFRLFAILVLINKAGFIGYFLEHSLCDDDLPFHHTPDFKKMWPNNKKEKDHIRFPDEVDDECDDEFIEDFARAQWSVLAPFFESPKSSSLRCNVYEFEDKTILPITHVSQNKHTGGFGFVERVQLHEKHHDFVSPSIACF